ncbi:MAG: hypothetical protein ACFFD2_10455 [Promethearchaeota archaeon]
MPKKEHVHVVTDEKHKKLLIKLGKKYGSMTKAFENAIKVLEKSETIGSCNDCKIKIQFNQINIFQKLLNTVTISADNVHEILKYLRGDYTARDLLKKAQEKAYQFSKQYFNFLNLISENSFDNLLFTIEKYKNLTQLFKTIESDIFSNKIIARVNVFEELPIFVMVGLKGFLNALGFTFNIEIHKEDLIITWIHEKKYQELKDTIEEKYKSYIEKAKEDFKPYWIKKGFMYITTQLFDWFARTTSNYQILPIEIAYNCAQLIFGENYSLERSEDMIKLLENSLKSMNIIEKINSRINKTKNRFTMDIVCRTPNSANIILQGFIQILAKAGWKLEWHQIDYKQLNVKFRYVGEDDPTIFEPLYIHNFTAYLTQNFQQLRLIPVDEFDDLTSALYSLDLIAFRKIFHAQGIKIANAVKYLAKNNLKKIREIGLKVLPQCIACSQRNTDNIHIIPEKDTFTLIFKKTNIVEMELLRGIILGVLQGFEYLDIQSKIRENMVIFKFTRPQEIEVEASLIEKIT